MRIDGIRVGFTADDGDWTSRRIQSVTGGRYSHTLLVLVAGECQVYYESIHKLDPMTGKRGLRGPVPLENLHEWADAPGERRRVEILPADGYLPLTDVEVELIRGDLQTMVPLIDYAELQILANWLEGRLGWSIRRRRGSATAWTCSETVLRILPARLWPAFDIPNLAADAVTPQTVYAAISRVCGIGAHLA